MWALPHWLNTFAIIFMSQKSVSQSVILILVVVISTSFRGVNGNKLLLSFKRNLHNGSIYPLEHILNKDEGKAITNAMAARGQKKKYIKKRSWKYGDWKMISDQIRCMCGRCLRGRVYLFLLPHIVVYILHFGTQIRAGSYRPGGITEWQPAWECGNGSIHSRMRMSRNYDLY